MTRYANERVQQLQRWQQVKTEEWKRGPELIVFALLINLTPPQGMSHIGFWMNMGCADTKTCPAFSNEFQPLRALGELACCDWHLLRRTVSLAEGTLTPSYSNQQ
ncbi:hypothetical protein D9C73_001042 [Collichthys lucidus]|uniref:Uncharacterized protein n=1 Tax=Collichthys lucidus TaxID=240159 RepID=A0A4U5U0T1_COLLU|nr:hypothetical protein D9C73_001042 [Collichthys lucidus]